MYHGVLEFVHYGSIPLKYLSPELNWPAGDIKPLFSYDKG